MNASLNPVTVVFLAYAAVTGVGPLFGVKDPLAAVMFVSAWMLPIPRMTLPRQPAIGGAAAESVRRVPLPLLVLGVLPWFALPWLHDATADSLFWKPLAFPPALKWLGMAFTVLLFSRPIIAKLRAKRAGNAGQVERRASRSLHGYIVTASAIFFISGHLFILVTAAFGFFCLYTLDRRTA